MDRHMDGWITSYHNVAQRRHTAGGSRDYHAWILTWMPPVMHSAMQASPPYALKTLLLTRITPTSALPLYEHTVFLYFLGNGNTKILTRLSSSFSRCPAAVVLSGQRDGQLPQPNNTKRPRMHFP